MYACTITLPLICWGSIVIFGKSWLESDLLCMTIGAMPTTSTLLLKPAAVGLDKLHVKYADKFEENFVVD